MKLSAILDGRFEYHDVFVTRREWFAIEDRWVFYSANLIFAIKTSGIKIQGPNTPEPCQKR